MLLTAIATAALMGQFQSHRQPQQVILKCQFYDVRAGCEFDFSKMKVKVQDKSVPRTFSIVGAGKVFTDQLDKFKIDQSARVISAPMLRTLDDNQAKLIQSLPGGGDSVFVTATPRIKQGKIELSASCCNGKPEAYGQVKGTTWNLTTTGVDGADNARVFGVKRPDTGWLVIVLTAYLPKD